MFGVPVNGCQEARSSSSNARSRNLFMDSLYAVEVGLAQRIDKEDVSLRVEAMRGQVYMIVPAVFEVFVTWVARNDVS